MATKLQKIDEGFTIVETLIVLAIAALILTIILIAVPSLQRSSRNTNIDHDAQAIASAIGDFENNNQGAVPTFSTAPSPPTVTVDGASGTISTSATVQGSDKVFIDSTVGDVKPSYSTSSAPAVGTIGPGAIQINLQATCNSAAVTVNLRAIAIYYPIESSTSSVGCVQA